MNKKAGICAAGIGLLAMSLLAVPTTASAESDLGQVHVIVENTTFVADGEDGAPWDGVLLDTWVDLNSSSTMMNCIYDALGDIPSEGADGDYIQSINGLAEFDGGFKSGWMGTLNDWFVNEGLAEFKVSEGELFAGDEIHVMYTCDYGVDLGADWESTDKQLQALNFSVGELTLAFASDTHEYTLVVPEGTDAVVVSPTAANKNYQVRTFKGETYYRRPASIPVADGDILTVVCGDPAWGSMSGQDTPAETYTIVIDAADSEPEPPAAPVLSGVKNAAKGVTVSWKAVEGADRYRVYRKNDSGKWEKLKDVTTLNYTDTAVSSGKSYTYTVRCRRDGLWSSYDKAGRTIVWLSQPTVKLANKTAGVTVTWGKVSGAAKYYVYRKTGSGSWTRLTTSTGTSYTDKTAASGTTYYYTVKAAKGSAYSTYDTTKKLLRLAEPKTSVAKVSGGIKVTWGKISGAKNYHVYRKTGASGKWTRLTTTTGTSYTDKTARTGTTYYYTVKAGNGSTYSSYTASKAIRR